ncbi:DUF11 domain-containing protein, partial [Gelidibacter salicanalis]|nr:hypothetical protein [Gelidibacter salicanalis]
MKHFNSPTFGIRTLLLKKSILFFTFFLASLSLLAQTVTTDKLDYLPGETAYATGSGWLAGENIVINIHEEPVYHPDVVTNITADANGSFTDFAVYDFEQHDYGSSFTLTATGQTSGNVAYAYFTDGAQSLWAWRKRGPTANTWNDGTTIQQANSIYAEDESIPFRWTIKTGNPAPQLKEGVFYIVRIEWDFAGGTTSPTTFFIDYLTTWNDTETAATGPFSDFFTGGNITTTPIPNDPQLLPAVQAQAVGGLFHLYNIDASTLTFVSGTASDRYVETPVNANQTRKYIEVRFTPNDGDATAGEFVNVAIAWGGHLGAESDYGLNKGANNFPGSSPQMLVDLTPTASGDQSNLNISPSAVVQQGKITIVKDAVPNSAQDFSFTSNLLGNFVLDDDTDPTLSNQKLFFGLAEGTYTFTENSTSGWMVTGVTGTENGAEDTTPADIFSGDIAASKATVTIANGEAWNIKFVNEVSLIPSLTVDKVVDLENISAPGTLTYAITVDNTGDVNITNVLLSDDLAGVATLDSGDTVDPGVLNVGETWIYSATYDATQADINAGTPLVNTASVETTQVPGPTTDSATTTIAQNPLMTVVKSSTTTEVTVAGQVITYSYLVTNTGNV